MNDIIDYLNSKMSVQGYVNISQATIELRTNSIVLLDIAKDLGLSFTSVNGTTCLVNIKNI